MTASFDALRGSVLRLAAGFAAALLVGSCGSGAVSNTVVDPDTITILPATATVYSGVPTTFSITGGNGQYIVTSNNQSVISTSQEITQANSLVIVPNQVLADTPVTITVRDTTTTAPASALVTVKPGTVNNTVTVIPSGTQGGACAPAVCSGGDAEVRATVAVGGVPLANHVVRMSVVSGDFLFITTPPGSTSETLATSIDVVSDQQGQVSARVRALSDAPNQTALLQVTDLDSGAFRRASFLIAQSTGTSPGFFVTPTSMTFSGRFVGQCASNISGSFFVYGGNPPYSVVNSAPSVFTLSDNTVFNSGDGFTINARGICGSGQFTVRDTAGHTTTVTASNIEGTATPTPVVAAPDTVTLTSCTSSASVTVAGGTGTYFVSVSSNSIQAFVNGSTVTIRRRIPSDPILPVPPATEPELSVGISDGRTTDTVTVQFSGTGADPC